MREDVKPAAKKAPRPAAMPPAAAIELYAFIRSLPPDGAFSPEDSQILKDWTTRYAGAPLPSRETLWDIVTKALSRGMISPEDRAWLYFAVDPALPRQLRRVVQWQRLLAEVRDARMEGHPCESVSFDFLLAGGHLSGLRERILGLAVNTPVRFIRDVDGGKPTGWIRVDLENGECVGFVPPDDTPSVEHAINVFGKAEGVVKKVLTDGMFPIPVIGTRIPYTASDADVAVPIEPWQEAPKRSLRIVRPTPSSPLTAITKALGAKFKPVANLFRPPS